MANDLERVFTNALGGPMGNPSNQGVFDGIPYYPEDLETYAADVAALIDDAADFEESSLQYDREENMRYYYGLEPNMSGYGNSDGTYESSNTNPEDDDAPSRSTVVSTDVQDTIMAVMPELMRIFTATEHSVDFQARSQQQDAMAKQATDYIRYKFWDENDGFSVLHSALLDCLQTKIGIITWWTEQRADVMVQSFSNISEEQVQMLLEENPSSEIVDEQFNNETGLYDSVAVRYQKVGPQLRVESVPPEEFRVSRNAKSVKTADLIGREEYVRAGDLIAEGFDPELCLMFAGEDRPYSVDVQLRNPYSEIGKDVPNDLVRVGRYFIRIDRDGDFIPELRHITVFGQNYFIVDDVPVASRQYSVFSPSPRQHTLIGNALADLAKDIQRINTNLVRGGLDSLAQSINPRTAVNETLTNIEDAMNEDLGAIIRTKGDPNNAVFPIIIPFVGKDAFAVKSEVDLIRQRRTGISEMSSGIDPKALQSTAVMGIDLIATAAQARIELIARVIAETGLAPMYKGLLEEVINNQNQPETFLVRGEWVEVNPSTFDPGMRVKVNPALGKGNDMTRLMALRDIRDTQYAIVQKFGLNNGFVGVENIRNTIVDMLSIANIRNVTRYFGEITPELKQAIESAPREPSPEELLAQAELEKSKAKVVEATAKVNEDARQANMRDDLDRDKMQTKAFTDVLGILAEFATAEMDLEAATTKAESYNTPSE